MDLNILCRKTIQYTVPAEHVQAESGKQDPAVRFRATGASLSSNRLTPSAECLESLESSI